MDNSNPLLISYHHFTLWGCCTRDKTMVIPREYEWAWTFKGDTAIIGKKKGNKVNMELLSRLVGKQIIPFI
jgi:hypothetical protein